MNEKALGLPGVTNTWYDVVFVTDTDYEVVFGSVQSWQVPAVVVVGGVRVGVVRHCGVWWMLQLRTFL